MLRESQRTVFPRGSSLRSLLFVLGSLCAFVVAHPVSHAQESPALSQSLKAIVQAQAEAWNRGDIDGFMDAYWKSEQLTFSSGGETERGWESTRRRYKQRYPDPQTMGKLTFSQLEVQSLGAGAALMLGRWQLERDEPIGGNFSLVWREIDNNWRIVHDHTSADSKK